MGFSLTGSTCVCRLHYARAARSLARLNPAMRSISMERSNPGTVEPLPGDHVCAFYRGPAERDRLMSAYVRDGSRTGHACLCVTGEEAGKDVLSALAGAGAHRLDGHDSRRGHRPSADAAEPMVRLIEMWSRDTWEQTDYSFAHVVADVTWALPAGDPPTADSIACYEESATTWASCYQQTCVCLYDLDRFGHVVLDVIKAHPRVWLHGVVLDNPYARGNELSAVAALR
jgi:hypothetical protein